MKSLEVKEGSDLGITRIYNLLVCREQEPALKIVFVLLVLHITVARVVKSMNRLIDVVYNMCEEDNNIALMIALRTNLITSN